MDDQGESRRVRLANKLRGVQTVGAIAIHNSKLEDLEPDEKLVTVIRKHFIGLVGIYLELAVAIIAVLAMVYFAIYGLFNDGSTSSIGLAAAGTIFIVALLFTFMLAGVYVYRKSQLIVTNKGVVQVLQYAPFNKKISRLSMANVEDVNVEQRGVLASMFNYGTLTIQTAGQEDNFIFTMCPRPDYFANQIIETRQQYVRIFGDQHSKD